MGSTVPPTLCRTFSEVHDDVRRDLKFSTEVLLEPLQYYRNMGGKKVRAQLLYAFNFWLQVKTDQTETISDIVDQLHNASLLIDDIEDESDLRREFQSAHKKFGLAPVLNSGNYVYFDVAEQVLALGKPEAMKIFIKEMKNLHEGQGMDLFWRDQTFTPPTEEEYYEMISHKTGGLFRLAIGLLQTHSTDTRDYASLIRMLGIHFQVRDDYMNLADENYHLAKGFCEDITEGKMSLPVIHALEHVSFGDRSLLLKILRSKTRDKAKLTMAFNIIKTAGSLQYTLDALLKLEDDIREEIANLGGNPGLTKILDHLCSSYHKA